MVEWAVAGHHPAYDHASPPNLNPPGGGVAIELLTGHDDFRTALDCLKGKFNLAAAPELPTKVRNLVGSDNVFAEIGAWARKSQHTWDKVKRTPDGRLVAAAKNALIAADVAGSALPKAKPDDAQRRNWITASFADKPEPGSAGTVETLLAALPAWRRLQTCHKEGPWVSGADGNSRRRAMSDLQRRNRRQEKNGASLTTDQRTITGESENGQKLGGFLGVYGHNGGKGFGLGPSRASWLLSQDQRSQLRNRKESVTRAYRAASTVFSTCPLQ